MPEPARPNCSRQNRHLPQLVGQKAWEKTKLTRTGKRQKKQTPGKLNVFRGSGRLLGIVRSLLVPEAGVQQTAFEQGNKALSENGGHPGGQFEPSSEGQIARQELLDALQLAWMTAGRLDLYTESTTERQKLERVQSQLSKMMRLVRGLATNKV